MSLPMLVSGADCGPVNPLQGLSKRLDQSRGVQQDFFGAGSAGSSKNAFRTQYSATPGASQDAARFFGSSQSHTPSLPEGATFDLSALHSSLSSPVAATRTPPPAAAWAADFLQQPAQHSPFQRVSTPPVSQQHDAIHHQAPAASQTYGPTSPLATSPYPGFASYASPNLMSPPLALGGPMLAARPAQVPIQAVNWEEAFQNQAAAVNSPAASLAEQMPAAEQAEALSQSSVQDADDLARTAGELINSVQHEQNPKFQKSAFLGLMRQLRDHEVVVQGSQMVANDGSVATKVDVKGKGRAVDVPVTEGPQSYQETVHPSTDRAFYRQLFRNRADESVIQPNDLDAYLRKENEDYIRHNMETAFRPRNEPARETAQTAEWGKLQQDWDAFEATATGIRPVTQYTFQAHNPYVLGEASRTQNHMMHIQGSSLYEGVLELEAAVQRDPHDVLRWYALGVKQQENEREHKAVQALRRALELDPEHLPSWLALGISHTNEGNRVGAYEAIRAWVEHNERYASVVSAFQSLNPDPPEATQGERFASLIQCLIEMARSAEGPVDADVQIALAVLMNTNEDYERAQDCFNAALAVRPDDWLLYNRVGATLANSGRPEEALQYYYRAIELNPAYIRARFNLGIACINLRRYEEASQHVLDALILQDSDSVETPGGDSEKRGVTSSALWSSLKTCCMHLQRIDLATFCDREDLNAFRAEFQI